MTYLESLAVRFVERDGLSVEEQDKIISDAVDCKCFLYPNILTGRQDRRPSLELDVDFQNQDIQTGYRNQRAGSESPALQLAKSIHQWHSLAGDDDDAASVAGESIEKKARGKRWPRIALCVVVTAPLTLIRTDDIYSPQIYGQYPKVSS